MTENSYELGAADRAAGSGPLRIFAGAVGINVVMRYAQSELALHMRGSPMREGLSMAEGFLLAQLLGTLFVGGVCAGALVVWLRRLGQSGGIVFERVPLSVASLLLLLATSAQVGMVGIDWLAATHDYSVPLDFKLYASIQEFLWLPAIHCWWIALAVVLVAARPPAGLAYVYIAMRAGLTLYGWLFDPSTATFPYLSFVGHSSNILWVVAAVLASRGMEPEMPQTPGLTNAMLAASGLRTIRTAMWLRVGFAFVGLLGLQILLSNGSLERADLKAAPWVLLAAELVITIVILSALSRVSSLSTEGVPTDGLGTVSIAIIVGVVVSLLGLAALQFVGDVSYGGAKNLLFIARWSPRLSILAGFVGSLAFLGTLGRIADWAEAPLGAMRATVAFWLTLGSGLSGMCVIAYLELGDPAPGVALLQSFAMLHIAGILVVLLSVTLRDVARMLDSRPAE